jgi:hypothetical protein
LTLRPYVMSEKKGEKKGRKGSSRRKGMEGEAEHHIGEENRADFLFPPLPWYAGCLTQMSCINSVSTSICGKLTLGLGFMDNAKIRWPHLPCFVSIFANVFNPNSSRSHDPSSYLDRGLIRSQARIPAGICGVRMAPRLDLRPDFLSTVIEFRGRGRFLTGINQVEERNIDGPAHISAPFRSQCMRALSYWTQSNLL